MSYSPARAHVADESLLRFLDGEAAGEERNGVRAHLRACPDCLRRAREIRELSAGVGAGLAEMDRTPPDSLLPRTFSEVRRRRGRAHGGGRPPLRWAAAVLLALGAGGVLASPLRARVLEWAERFLGEAAALAGVSTPVRAPGGGGAPEAGADARPSELSFVPEGPELRLEFSHPQQGGALRVSGAPGRSASFRVLDRGADREAVLVLPSGLRVRNIAEGRTSYLLAVPGSVEVVRVVVGGRAPVLVRTASLPPGEEHPVPLDAAAEP